METKKRMSREQKREQAVIDLINQMFIIAGHEVTYNDVLGKNNWFQEYSMTVEQGEEFKKWGKKYLMKNLRIILRNMHSYSRGIIKERFSTRRKIL